MSQNYGSIPAACGQTLASLLRIGILMCDIISFQSVSLHLISKYCLPALVQALLASHLIVCPTGDSPRTAVKYCSETVCFLVGDWKTPALQYIACCHFFFFFNAFCAGISIKLEERLFDILWCLSGTTLLFEGDSLHLKDKCMKNTKFS